MTTPLVYTNTKTSNTNDNRTLTLIYVEKDGEKYYNLLYKSGFITSTVPHFDNFYKFDNETNALTALTKLYDSTQKYNVDVTPKELLDFNESHKEELIPKTEVNPPKFRGGGEAKSKISSSLESPQIKNPEKKKDTLKNINSTYTVQYIRAIEPDAAQEQKTNLEKLQTVCQCLYTDIQSPSIHPHHVRLFQEPDLPHGPRWMDYRRRRHR